MTSPANDRHRVGPAELAELLSLLLTALASGVFFGTRVSLGPSTRGFGPRTYVEVQQATVRNLRPVMGPLLPAAVVANLAVVAGKARDRRSPAFALAVTGTLAQLLAAGLTVGVELPINADVLTWSPQHPPRGWETVRDRWQTVHGWRTAASVLGLGCVVAAALAPAGRDQRDATG